MKIGKNKRQSNMLMLTLKEQSNMDIRNFILSWFHKAHLKYTRKQENNFMMTITNTLWGPLFVTINFSKINKQNMQK